MTNDNAWIQNLKTGDLVAVSRYQGSYTHMSTATVKKVTPGGKVRLDNDVLYDVEGREVNGDAWATHSFLRTIAQYEEWQEQKAAIAHKKELIKQVTGELENMTITQLENILKIAGVD